MEQSKQPGTQNPSLMGPRDWKKMVTESGGLMHFVPKDLITAFKDWDQTRHAFNKVVDDLAKQEAELGHKLNVVMFDVRTSLEKEGVDTIWSKDVGMNMDALKDGEFIINVTPPRIN